MARGSFFISRPACHPDESRAPRAIVEHHDFARRPPLLFYSGSPSLQGKGLGVRSATRSRDPPHHTLEILRQLRIPNPHRSDAHFSRRLIAGTIRLDLPVVDWPIQLDRQVGSWRNKSLR